MITINLLPIEYRKAERTPIVVFLPVVLGLICTLSAGAVAAYVHFARLSEVVNQRRTFQSELDQKKPNLKFEEALLAEEKEYKGRADTISDIASSRILMTKKMDELWTTIANGDANGEYFVWLTELKALPPKTTPGAKNAKNAGPRSGGEYAMKGYTLADRDPLQDFNRLHGAVKASPLFKECIEINNPEGKIFSFNDERTPCKGWTVDLSLTLLHPSELAKSSKKNAASQVAEKPGKKNQKR
jgi:hypothetical protein